MMTKAQLQQLVASLVDRFSADTAFIGSLMDQHASLAETVDRLNEALGECAGDLQRHTALRTEAARQAKAARKEVHRQKARALLAKGHSKPRIAGELDLSERYVRELLAVNNRNPRQ